MIERVHDDNAIAWRPTDDVVARAQLTRFISFCGLATFDELYRRSVTDIEWFTEQVVRFLDIQFDKAYDRIVDLSRGGQWPRWLIGGRLNIVRSCLDRWGDTIVGRPPAVILGGGEGGTRGVDYAHPLIAVRRVRPRPRARGYCRGG